MLIDESEPQNNTIVRFRKIRALFRPDHCRSAQPMSLLGQSLPSHSAFGPPFVRSCPIATKLLQCRDCPLCATCVFRYDAKKQRDFSPSPTNRPKCVARASDLSRRATNDLVFNLQLESTSLIISLRDKQDRYSDANNASIEAKARLVGLPLATHGFRSKSKFGIPQANSPPQSHPGP